jgi:molecular chaperone GrpE
LEDDREIEEVQQSRNEQEPNKDEEITALSEELKYVKEELSKVRESSQSNLNKLKYLMADFDNYRKQMEKQVASKVESSKAEVLLKFLSIRDDYVRALETAKQSKSEAVVLEGLEAILKNLDSLLRSEGVMEIETIGTPFDPNIHDALSFSYRDDVPENMVTSEIRKGYMLNNKVLRPSLVEISKKIVKNIINDTETIEKETRN